MWGIGQFEIRSQEAHLGNVEAFVPNAAHGDDLKVDWRVGDQLLVETSNWVEQGPRSVDCLDVT